ncbi:MAG: hypothetical protein WBC93_04455 [Sulfitobacter sp.]
MSAPETNVKKQKRQHGPVLVGIVAAVAVAIIAAISLGVTIDEDRDLEGVTPAETDSRVPETQSDG